MPDCRHVLVGTSPDQETTKAPGRAPGFLNREPLGIIGCVGVAVWTIGILIEIGAGQQESALRANPADKGQFISTSLRACSRHPNCPGGMLWVGMAIVAGPVLEGWQRVYLISSVFVILVLTRVGGIPVRERGRRALGRPGGLRGVQAENAGVRH